LKTHVNWFTHEQADSLSALWPLFYAKWNDPYWNETLTRAIWFYVAGVRQSGGSDSALILAHAGLELLAWAKLIQTDHLISERGFDQLVAADKLRLLVAAMKLDLKIHSSQKQLEELARKEKWSAAPWALTEIRNALVHPKRRTSLNAHVINEAYTLAMHYFELGLLFVLGYRGKYTNRLIIKFHFDTEQVPWSSRVELKSQKGDITGHH
jgi:hypothetical protein